MPFLHEIALLLSTFKSNDSVNKDSYIKTNTRIGRKEIIVLFKCMC